MSGDNRIKHALSFDIEDWFHIVEIKAVEDTSKWREFSSLVEPRTRQILGLLKKYDTRATFFILGWIADRYPGLVRMIADEGHEIGTHSFWHKRVYEMDRESFKKDLEDSIEVIEGNSGVKVYGFRAPSFSIIPGAEWAFGVMKRSGIEYDASLFPARRGHGGYPCRLGPHWFGDEEEGRMPELPMSVMEIGPYRLCFSGGGYLRLLPCRLIEYGISREERMGRPAVVYLHPRDFAPDCPSVPMPFYRRFKSYVGLGTTERKLERLLQRYSFAPCREVLKERLEINGWND